MLVHQLTESGDGEAEGCTVTVGRAFASIAGQPIEPSVTLRVATAGDQTDVYVVLSASAARELLVAVHQQLVALQREAAVDKAADA